MNTSSMGKFYNSFAAYCIAISAVTFFLVHPRLCESTLSGNIDPETQRKIDDFIENVYLPASKISGMGLTIVQNDWEILYTNGYGLADRENGIPNGNSTQFLIGSVTKSFTSVLVGKLLHENFPTLGEAALDTPIRRLSPNFTLIDRFRSEQITFRDLLAHRVCLFQDDFQLMADPFNSTEEISYRARYNREICGVRGEFQYNNQMYVMAGDLIGILANKPYEDAMKDLLIEIGMTNTTFVQRTDDFSQMPFRAMPYYVKDNEIRPINRELVKRVKLHNAAGGLFATPNDMAKYLRFHLNLGNVDGKQIVPREVMGWLTKPSIVLPAFQFKNSDADLIVNGFGYGLGLMLTSYDGWSMIGHGGYFPPYTSHISLFPAKKLGIFTSTNMGPVLQSSYALHAFIFETLKGSQNSMEKAMKLNDIINSGKKKQKNKSKNGFQDFQQKIVEKSGTNRVAIIGKYGSGSLGDVEVLKKFNDQTNKTEYYFEYGRWYKGWLQNEVNGVIFKLIYDTDVIQDEYADGLKGDNTFVAFVNDTLYVFSPLGNTNYVRATFNLGLSLDKLPPIPWNPDSCGSE